MSNPSLIAHTIKGTGDFNNVTSNAVDSRGSGFAFVAISQYYTGGETTMTDTYANAWLPLTIRANAVGAKIRTFWCRSPLVGATHQIIVTSTGLAPSVGVQFWGGVGIFNVENGGSTVGPVTSFATGSITPSQATALTIAAISIPLMSAGFAVNSGFTPGDNVVTSGFNFGLGLAYKIGNTGAQNPTFSWTTGSDAAAEIAAFNTYTPTMLGMF